MHHSKKLTIKKKLLISFSGGETSAYMTWLLWTTKQDEYEMLVVFANTGEENEETLIFVDKFSSFFKIPVAWVEACVHKGRIGTTHIETTFENAARNGEPFEAVVKKYGIPNKNYPHCTRELKQRPIESYAKHLGWKNYYTAIGIRYDEIDRQSDSNLKLAVTEQPLSGRKIRNFSEAMKGNPDAIVCDIWICRAFDVDRKYVRQGYNVPLSGGPTDKIYTAVENYFQSEASGIGLEPREMCAMVWAGIRIYEGANIGSRYENYLLKRTQQLEIWK